MDSLRLRNIIGKDCLGGSQLEGNYMGFRLFDLGIECFGFRFPRLGVHGA